MFAEDVNSLLNNRNQFDERHFQPQSLTLNWEPQHTPQSSCYFSDVYHLFEFGCSLRFKCHVNSSYFQIEYLRRENDVSFPLNGYHAFTFIVGEQGNHQTLKRCCEPFFDDSEFPPFEPFFTSWGSSFFQNSIENGKALVKIIVEPLTHLIMREPRQYGTLMWKIDKLKATREKHLIGSEYLWSQSFYSSDKGYRMKVLLGLGHDVHALLCFLKGPWDKDLLKSSEHLITIRIINQNDPSGQLDVLTEKTCKCLNMCLLSILQKDNDVEKCVKDDTLVIHLKVQPCL